MKLLFGISGTINAVFLHPRRRLFSLFIALCLLLPYTGCAPVPAADPAAQPEATPAAQEDPETESNSRLRATAPARTGDPPSAQPCDPPSAQPCDPPSAQPSPSVRPSPPVTGGSYETEIVDFSKNRIKNIKLAIKKLNGSVIKSGDEFSFNKTVGPRTMKKGYKDAIIFVNGEKVKETGGGICQVSTTIYQAALDAGFEITERHQHQREVYYVELGDDATVYYGRLDFKFINDSGRDMKLKCWIGDGIVGVSFEPL